MEYLYFYTEPVLVDFGVFQEHNGHISTTSSR